MSCIKKFWHVYTWTSKVKYFFKFFMIITRKGSLIPKVLLGSAGHVINVVLTFVPSISSTKDWISLSVILLICPLRTCKYQTLSYRGFSCIYFLQIASLKINGISKTWHTLFNYLGPTVSYSIPVFSHPKMQHWVSEYNAHVDMPNNP